MKKSLLNLTMVVGGVLISSASLAQYCVSGGPGSTADSNVESAMLAGETTTINYTGCPGVLGVEDQTGMSADLLTGYSYTVSIFFGTCGGNYGNAGEAWIDFNNDSVFDPSESIAQTSGTPGTAPWDAVQTFNFTVPVGASLGTTRMRIMQNEGGTNPLDPCGSPFYGSVVDFHIDIQYGTSCAGVTGLTADYIGTDSVAVSWTAGTELGWNFELGAAGFTPGTGSEVYGSNPVAANEGVNGLTLGTDYDVYVQADCGADSSQWIGPLSVTTLLTCPSPSGFGGIVLASDSISLAWTPGDSSETEWQIEYGMSGYTPGTGTIVSVMGSPSDTVTGLMGGTQYDFYLQAICGVADSSFWIGPISFQTPASNDEACDAIVVMADGSTGTYSNVGATSNGSEPGDVSPSRSVWFKFAHPTATGFTVETCGSTWDTQIAAYTASDCGDYAGFGFLAYNDDACGLQSSIEICTTPGDTIYVVVDPFGTTEGNFNLTVTPLASEAGTGSTLDFCAGDTTSLWPALTGNDDMFGTWTYSVNPGAVMNDSLFNSNMMTLTGTEIYYILSNACASDTATVMLNAEQPGATGTPITPFNTCNTYNTVLWDGLSGSLDLGGSWNDDTGTGLLIGSTFQTDGIPVGTYQFTYTINNGICPASSTTVDVVVNDCVGVDEHEAMDFTVYPNPSQGEFFVKNNGFIGEVVIQMMDINGKLVYNEVKNLGGSEIIEISGEFNTGLYMVSLVSADKSSNHKVVIK